MQDQYCYDSLSHCFEGHLNTGEEFSVQYSPKTNSHSRLSFHFSSLFVVIVVVVDVVVVLAVTVVETILEFSFVSLLPLTVIVVTVFPSGDTTVFVSKNSFFIDFSFQYRGRRPKPYKCS